MKGNESLLTVLDQLLADELTAINEYMVHSEMCSNWGYNKLHESIRKQAMDEMHHAEWLIERIIFLEDIPLVSKLNPIRIGTNVSEMIANITGEELHAVRSYNDAIKLAREVEDQGTVDLLAKILAMEEGHIEWAESQETQIKQMGIENYLSSQSEGSVSKDVI